jgi:hypothetical protein
MAFRMPVYSIKGLLKKVEIFDDVSLGTGSSIG